MGVLGFTTVMLGATLVATSREESMNMQSLIVSSVFALGFAAVPAIAQQPSHRYLEFFRYSDTAVKAMTENPQDRSAQAAKLAESFGGKVESIYFFPAGSEYDGMVIFAYPAEVAHERQS